MLSDEQIGRILAGESPIRVIREHRGMSMRELARKAGIRVDQLERYEKGRNAPRADRLKVIAEVLGVDPIDLRPCEQNFADCAKRLRRLPDDG